MRKFMGGVIGFFVGGWLVLLLFLFIADAVAGPVSTSDMTTGGVVVVFFGPPAALVGAIIGAVAGVRIASGGKDKPEPGSTFVRQGSDTHCKRCGSDLIGLGGPCRKCDDVKTRPCSSCSLYILANDKTCVYCGADLK